MLQGRSVLAIAALAAFAATGTAFATTSIEKAKQTAQLQVRQLIEPLIERYCNEHCRLLTIDPTVEAVVPETIAPGFDESMQAKSLELQASTVRVKMLVDEMLGPVSRGKILDLIQQHLDALAYPVAIETKIIRFPQPASSSRRVAEIREKIQINVRQTLEELFAKYCQDRCLLGELDIQVDPVNAEEAQYGSSGEFIQEGNTAVRIRNIGATVLMDTALFPEERANILEMARLQTAMYKNVNLDGRSMQFPSPERMASFRDRVGRGLASAGNADKFASDSKLTNDLRSNKSVTDERNSSLNTTNNVNESASRTEKFERFEKIERVEDGDAVQAELNKFKVYGLIFGCAILSLLIFLALMGYRPRGETSPSNPVTRIFQNLMSDPAANNGAPAAHTAGVNSDDRAAMIKRRYEIEGYVEELSKVYAEQPKVAKQVFSRVLTEEGVEITAQYIDIFGEGVVMDMLRDPSLQRDVTELMEFYARNTIDLADDEKLELLRGLHNITIASKMYVMGNRSTVMFDFLVDMDDMQILELVRNESLTVKAIVLTQCDPLKRDSIYGKFEDATRMSLLTELSRIDHLPKDYIQNVASALKRKRLENPRLNTQALPGSEVLVGLLERTPIDTQRSVVQHLEQSNPDSASNVKNKLISLDTLHFLRDQHLLEIILSLRHDELLQFLKGTTQTIRQMIFSKCPRDLVAELDEELESVQTLGRETYNSTERKILNRIKKLAGEGKINLLETNERMFSSRGGAEISAFETAPPPPASEGGTLAKIKKVAGW